MPASALFILDNKGKTLIWRNYRGDVPLNTADRFFQLLTETEESAIKPIIEEDGLSYVYVKHNSLFFLAVCTGNANVTMVLLFLHQLVEVFTSYFKELEEESIRDNFVIIYELLDEMLDYGYPQATEAKILQEYITQEGYKLETAARPPPALTNAVSWRGENIKYRKNEVFLDVIEKVNLLINSNGTPLRSEIIGIINVRPFLSGMPELRLGLNDRVQWETSRANPAAAAKASQAPGQKPIEMEDVTFHQCVRLSRFEHDKTISFIPPDEPFELMTYRLNTNVRPLIAIEAVVDAHARSRVDYFIKARSQFKERSVANNVEIIVPVPSDADSPKFRASTGSLRYAAEEDAIVWKIRQFPGGKEYLMRAQFGLPSITNEEVADKKRPIQVKFEIPYYTVSGIQVRYLKIIERSGYQALPWVRYVTQSGDYSVRI